MVKDCTYKGPLRSSDHLKSFTLHVTFSHTDTHSYTNGTDHAKTVPISRKTLFYVKVIEERDGERHGREILWWQKTRARQVANKPKSSKPLGLESGESELWKCATCHSWTRKSTCKLCMSHSVQLPHPKISGINLVNDGQNQKRERNSAKFKVSFKRLHLCSDGFPQLNIFPDIGGRRLSFWQQTGSF